MNKILVSICDECDKPWFGRSKSTDRCWCDPSPGHHEGYIEADKCQNCDNYFDHYGHDIKCELHRTPCTKEDKHFLVGCRKCDDVIMSYEIEDSLCSNCI